MNNTDSRIDLTGRRVLVPGGTGTVGEGVVRRYLEAGADVVVPTRTQARADEYRAILDNAGTDKLHLVVHDYTTFAGADDLVDQMTSNLGGIDDVIAPIGGWWAGKRLWEISETDWQNAFVGLATAHMAIARAAVPRITAEGAYVVVVGDSGGWPVPGSGLVSMEQSALMMMQRVLDAEVDESKRIFTFVLGPVNTRSVGSGEVTARQVGSVAVAASASALPGRVIPLHGDAEVEQAILLFEGA